MSTTPPTTLPMLHPSHFLSLPRPSHTSTTSHATFDHSFDLESATNSINIGIRDAPIVDTTTLAAHDFDVDPRTGFMPPQPPLARLSSVVDAEMGVKFEYEMWEEVLDDACGRGEKRMLQLGDKKGGLSLEERERNERWRDRVGQLPVIPIAPLLSSEITLRRAHLVLAWILHFYVHSHPPIDPSSNFDNGDSVDGKDKDDDIHIPPPLTLPLLQVSRELQLPPVLTYSDDVLYNWDLTTPTISSDADSQSASDISSSHSEVAQDEHIDPSRLRTLTTFTSTPSESHFYLTSARIELIGVRALSVMQSAMDELFVGDAIAVRRISALLRELGGSARDTDTDRTKEGPESRGIIGQMEMELKRMKEGCDPKVFYEEIRPWFRGVDSVPAPSTSPSSISTAGPSTLREPRRRRWHFHGLSLDSSGSLRHPEESQLSGPSAGQSSLIHALDIFLGVQQYSHTSPSRASSASASNSDEHSSTNAEDGTNAEVGPTASGRNKELDKGSRATEKQSFLSRMQLFMPRHHRNFLSHLQAQEAKGRSLRRLVLNVVESAGITIKNVDGDGVTDTLQLANSSFLQTNSTSKSGIPNLTRTDALALLDAYNAAVHALRKLRDAHIVIVTTYIISPAGRERAERQRERERVARGLDAPEDEEGRNYESEGRRLDVGEKIREMEDRAPLKGTGGTDLARFLKGVRDGTQDAVITPIALSSSIA